MTQSVELEIRHKVTPPSEPTSHVWWRHKTFGADCEHDGNYSAALDHIQRLTAHVKVATDVPPSQRPTLLAVLRKAENRLMALLHGANLCKEQRLNGDQQVALATAIGTATAGQLEKFRLALEQGQLKSSQQATLLLT